MVFSFNFGSTTPDEEQQKKQEFLGDERPSDISWKKAEEIFLDNSHLCALGLTIFSVVVVNSSDAVPFS